MAQYWNRSPERQNGRVFGQFGGETEGGYGGGPSSNGIRTNSNGLTKENELKTPLALLHDLCQKSNATVSYPFEGLHKNSKPGQILFHCILQVTTVFEDVFEGEGTANSKKNARHAAARDVLLQMNPKCEEFMNPDYGMTLSYEDGGGDYATDMMPNIPAAVSQQQMSQERHQRMNKPRVEHEIVRISHPVEVDAETGDVIVTAAEDDELRITIRMPKSNPQPVKVTQEAMTDDFGIRRNLSVEEKIGIVKGWEGPKIRKLQGYTKDGVFAIQNPVMVVGKITSEQNLKFEFVMLTEDDKDGDKHSCILEVSSNLQQQSSLQFNSFGSGDSPPKAKEAAAKNFLEMIRMMINSS